MLIRSFIIALCLLPVSCVGDPTPSLDDDAVGGPVELAPVSAPELAPVCVAPETMNYRIDESLAADGFAAALSGAEVFNEFSLDVLGREVLAYQGRSTHWTPGSKSEPVTINVTKTDAEFEQFIAEHPECAGRNPGGCGLYHKEAFVHAGRLQKSFSGMDLVNLVAYVAAHEVGHVLGSGHLPGESSLMSATARFERPVLSDADKGWFCKIYCCSDQYPVIE